MFGRDWHGHEPPLRQRLFERGSLTEEHQPEAGNQQHGPDHKQQQQRCRSVDAVQLLPELWIPAEALCEP